EGGTATLLLDETRRFGRDLHQAARAGTRGRVVELRLGVDHGRDQGRVDVLFAGLLTDDVVVVQRQRELVDSPVDAAELEQGERQRQQPDRGDPGPERQQSPGPLLHLRSLSISADKARSRSSTEPSFSITWSARAAFSSWVSCRASRSSTRA